MWPDRRASLRTAYSREFWIRLAIRPFLTRGRERPTQGSGARCGVAGRWQTLLGPSGSRSPGRVDSPKTRLRRRLPRKRVSRRKPRIRLATNCFVNELLESDKLADGQIGVDRPESRANRFRQTVRWKRGSHRQLHSCVVPCLPHRQIQFRPSRRLHCFMPDIGNHADDVPPAVGGDPCPSGFWPGQSARANVSLITTAGSLVARSRSVRSLLNRKGMPAASRYPSLTTRMNASG